MSEIFVTIHEPTAERAIERITTLSDAIDGVELRVDAFSLPGDELNLAAFRNATSKKLMYTRRARAKEERAQAWEFWAAHDAGFDLVDVEVVGEYDAIDLGWIPEGVRFITGSDKAVLSIHDWEGVPQYLDSWLEQMSGWDFKLAVTPGTFEQDLRLLRALEKADPRVWLTLFGMGERGMYSRILAPFFGSRRVFVAADETSIAAPGQITIEEALRIYGDAKKLLKPDALFAVVGNPAAHSRSPLIHNPIFRERSVHAAYSIIDTDEFMEVADRFLRGEELVPVGLSITAPFKEEAFRFAGERGARMSSLASRARAVNTLVRFPDGSLQAGNTDVSGFTRLLGQRTTAGSTVLVVGAGGTARAALAAVEQLRLPRAVSNRSEEKGRELAREFGAEFIRLEDLQSANAAVIIDTIPASADFILPPEITQDAVLVSADYSSARQYSAREIIDGLALLQAQAVEQSAVFVHAANAWSRRTA